MLSRRVHGPRRVVLAWDPAVDDVASDLSAYRDSGWDFDAGHLKIKEGQKATIWRLAPLTEAQKRRAKGLDVESPDWADFVFRCCCHGVQNYLLVDESGERDVPDVVRRDVPGIGEMVTPEWLESSRLILDDILGVAMVGWQLSEARVPL